MTRKRYGIAAIVLAAVILAAGGALCYRHFRQTAQIVPLSEFRNQIYAVRVLESQKEMRQKR